MDMYEYEFLFTDSRYGTKAVVKIKAGNRSSAQNRAIKAYGVQNNPEYELRSITQL